MRTQEKINTVYRNIQHLHIQPDEQNTMLLADCFITLKEAYQDVGEMERELESLRKMMPQDEPQEEDHGEESNEEG